MFENETLKTQNIPSKIYASIYIWPREVSTVPEELQYKVSHPTRFWKEICCSKNPNHIIHLKMD